MRPPVSREFGPAAGAPTSAAAGPSDSRGRPGTNAALMDLLDNLDIDMLPDDRRGIYIVGGAVRDLIMTMPPVDVDLVVDGDIHQTAAAIAAKRGGKTVDLGKKPFAVLRVALPGLNVDITPLGDRSIETDLRRRDFTVNAMAIAADSGRLVDATGGMADIAQKTVRMVSPESFADDPVRLVRAYRLAAMLRFSIAGGTRAAIRRERRRIGRIAAERIWAELAKLLTLKEAAPTLREMAADGLLTAIIPELDAAIGCTQNAFHQFDVFEHSLRVVKAVEELLTGTDDRFPERTAMLTASVGGADAATLKFAALLHDAGKPACRRIHADGRVTFHGHAAKSAAVADTVGRRLRLSRRQREATVAIVRHHIRPLFLFTASTNGRLGERGMVRFFNHCGDQVLAVIAHTAADIMAKNAVPQPRDRAFLAFCSRLLNHYRDYCRRRTQDAPLIGGRDLITRFHLSPSPQFKRILKRVEEQRLAGTLSTRRQALDWVAAYLARDRPPTDA